MSTTESHNARLAAGHKLTTLGPAWLRLVGDPPKTPADPDRRVWMTREAEVKIVVQIFEMAVDGLGSTTIADRLNNEGKARLGDPDVAQLRAERQHQTQGQTPPTEQELSVLWTPQLVVDLLQNRAVIGELGRPKARQPSVAGYYLPIISREAFDAVQMYTLRRRQLGGRAGANLFGGLIRCECGERVRYEPKTPHDYLRCSKADCPTPRTPYAAVEDALLRYLIFIEEEIIRRPQVAEVPLPQPQTEADRGRTTTYVAIRTLQEHWRLQDVSRTKTGQPELAVMRSRMRAAISVLVNDIVLLHAKVAGTYDALEQDRGANIDDPKDDPEDKPEPDPVLDQAAVTPCVYRQILIWGPVVDAGREPGVADLLYHEGGFLLEYVVPPGFVDGAKPEAAQPA